MSLNIEIISSNTYTDSKHFLFIVIFVNLRIFAGSVSHDVRASMKRFSQVRATLNVLNLKETVNCRVKPIKTRCRCPIIVGHSANCHVSKMYKNPVPFKIFDQIKRTWLGETS